MGQTESLFAAGRPTCRELPATAGPSRGAARVCTNETSFRPGMTLYTNLMDERALVDDGSRPIYGARTIDPATGVAGDYEWVTYDAFTTQVATMAAGMKRALGLQRHDRVGLFAKNRYEWVLVEHATSRMAYQLVPLYDTLGPSAIPYIMNHTEMRVLFVGKQQFTTLMKSIDECASVKVIVQFEDVDETQRDEVAFHDIQLKSLKEVLEEGTQHPVEADPPHPDDIATICYTSGTTGSPKGVLLSHANLVAAARAAQDNEQILRDDVHLCYLPLPHAFERVIQVAIISAGGCIGFYQGDVTKLIDDLQTLRPTIFPSVPRVLNRIHDRIVGGVEAAGGIKKWLFDIAYASKKHYLADGYVHHKLWDTLVFSKVQQLVGGRMRVIMNGSAPISKDCKELLQVVFGCAVIEGYGMTETGGVISLSTRAFAPGSHVGIPGCLVQVCLHDVPEMNYSSQDKPESRGEICIKGPMVFKGYYNEPERTAEVIDADGWLHTGDIGKWNEDGTLSIIDRKKNIFKLSQGEYIAPEKIENVYLKSSLVAQVLVYGHSLQNYVVGVVVPDQTGVTDWANKFNNGSTDPESLKAAILKDLDALAVKHGLFKFERIQKVHLDNEPWTVENNLITPTFKLKRPQLVAHYQNELNAMYSK